MYSDWLLLTDRCIVIGCLLIESLDTYSSMTVRFTSPATRGFLLPLLSLLPLFSLSCLVSSQQKKTSGTRVQVHVHVHVHVSGIHKTIVQASYKIWSQWYAKRIQHGVAAIVQAKQEQEQGLTPKISSLTIADTCTWTENMTKYSVSNAHDSACVIIHNRRFLSCLSPLLQSECYM